MSEQPSGGVLVAGVGNIFLGDDGFGCAVAARLSRLSPGVRAVDYGIRGMHLAYDLLAGVDLLVLVDALPDRGEPGRVHVLEVAADDVGPGAVDAHGMDPASVLANLQALGGTMPRTIVVGCEVNDVGEGMRLSPAVEAAVDEAVRTVRDVLERELEVV